MLTKKMFLKILVPKYSISFILSKFCLEKYSNFYKFLMSLEETIQNCPKIKLEDYDLGNRIATSSFGYIYEATERETGKSVFIKIFINKPMNEELKKYFIREINTSHINIPGIVKTIGYRFPLSPEEAQKSESEYKNDYIVVTEFMENGCFAPINQSYLNSNGNLNDKINPTIRSKIVFGAAVTMSRLHKMKIIHRDLKLENIWLDEKLEPRIGDFCLARFIENDVHLTINVGTPICMAPELFTEENYGFPVDVYAFGILLYRLFTTEIVLEDLKPIRTPYHLKSKIAKGLRFKKPNHVPEHYWELIQKCWKQEPSERPKFEEIVEILKDDKFALEEFGMKTDLNELHEYQDRMDINE